MVKITRYHTVIQLSYLVGFFAVKMLKEEINNDAQSVKRFINESKAVSMLSHPNIVSIYDVSVKDNLKYIVMEHVEGITLKNYINTKKVMVQNVLCHRIYVRITSARLPF